MSFEIPYSFCEKCGSVENIYNFDEDLDYNIDKFNYNFRCGEYINSYFQNCKCSQPYIPLNKELITIKYNLPNKNVITDFAVILFCKDLMYSKKNLHETLIPSNKEYFEIILHIIKTDWYPLKFNNMNVTNFIYNNFIKQEYTIDNIFKVGFTDPSLHELLDLYKFYKDNRYFKHCNYFLRLKKLKNKDLFNRTTFERLEKQRCAPILREYILDSMYNPRTILGQKMFDIRLKLDNIDTIIN